MSDHEVLVDLGDATVETREPPQDVAPDNELIRGYEDGAL
jgi:hypothetical protein